jgi:hypothetical protein
MLMQTYAHIYTQACTDMCRNVHTHLEEGTGQFLQGLQECALCNLVVEPHNSHVLFACILLTLDQPCGPLDTHNQTSCHLHQPIYVMVSEHNTTDGKKGYYLGVQGAAVAGLLNTENAADPRNHLRMEVETTEMH